MEVTAEFNQTHDGSAHITAPALVDDTLLQGLHD